MSDGFLSRWSRRKQEVREGKPVEAEPVAPALATPGATPLQRDPAPVAQGKLVPASESGAAPAEPPPSLADVQALTPQSDFKRFVAPDVQPEVKNAAMKKLFADPHFNAMDGLDVYIDDYSKPDPLPAAMARQLASAQFLKLFGEQDEQKVPPQGRDAANNPDGQTMAQSPQEPPAAPTDAHTDLRLQQDDAVERRPAGPGDQ